MNDIFFISSGTVVEYTHFTDSGLQNITVIYCPTQNVNMSLHGVKSTGYDSENLTYEYHYLFRLHS